MKFKANKSAKNQKPVLMKDWIIKPTSKLKR